MRFRPALTALTSAVFLSSPFIAGCTSNRFVPIPTPSGSGLALGELAAAASKAQSASFTATYQAESTNPVRSATIHVYREPGQTRLDVFEAGALVRIQVDFHGTFSCKFPAGQQPLCVRLAPAGQAPASALDPGLQHLFTDGLDELATGNGIHVSATVTHQTIAGLAASCYAITSVPTAAAITPGTVCFTADGVLARAQYRSGSLTLSGRSAAPVDSDFTLPASAAPLASPSAAASS